jgi:hypothetical protein
MVKVNKNDVKTNKNDRNNIINTYIYHNVKAKLFKYCIKCGKDFPTPSQDQFCCWECRKEYYQELRADMDDVINEVWGRD